MNFLGTFVMRSCNAPFPQGLHPRGGEGGGLGTPGGTCKSATYHHQPQESPPPPSPPKATRAPYILHTNKTFTGEVSFLFFASTLLLHCGASFFPSLFPSLSGSLSSNLERVHMIIRYHMCSWAL